MSRKEKSFTIDGEVYTATQLGALEGRKLWLKIVKVLAGPMRQLNEAQNAEGEVVLRAISGVVEGLNDETTEELYEAFGKSCTVRVGERSPNLTGVIFDNHFAGEYVRMSQWLGQMILFNFASFLGDGATGKLAELTSRAASKFASPTESTGSSGES